MGTHPIFESDFDCLTDKKEVLKTMTDNGLKEPNRARKVITNESIKSIFASSDEPETDDTIIRLTLPKKPIPKKNSNPDEKKRVLKMPQNTWNNDKKSRLDGPFSTPLRKVQKKD